MPPGMSLLPSSGTAVDFFTLSIPTTGWLFLSSSTPVNMQQLPSERNGKYKRGHFISLEEKKFQTAAKNVSMGLLRQGQGPATRQVCKESFGGKQ